METLWFWLVAIMIVGYVVLDGFDLGAGIIHLIVAKTEQERDQVLASIGPVWDGNEVWLLAAGGTLYFAFPELYAASFSGFYLPLMIVLWLLMLRGIAIEFRHHMSHKLWNSLWDAVFSGASILLAIFYGAALGNVIRGVPFGDDMQFFLPLWTHFGVVGEVGILDWFTISIGVFAFAALTHHGALWVALKTEGPVRDRAFDLAGAIWYGLAFLTVGATFITGGVQPQVFQNLSTYRIGYLAYAATIAALVASWWFRKHGQELKAFLASTGFIAGMLVCAVFGVYPKVLPSNLDPDGGLTIYNAATSPYGMRVGLIWWIPGVLIAIAYFVFLYRNFAGKIPLKGEEATDG